MSIAFEFMGSHEPTDVIGYGAAVVLLSLMHCRLERDGKSDAWDVLEKVLGAFCRGTEYDIVGFGTHWIDFLK